MMHLGTDTPSPYQRYRHFTDLWNSWEGNTIHLVISQFGIVLEQISKWDIRNSWDYQIRYSNKPGVDREVRFREPEHAIMMLLVLKGGKQ